jgi:hypothetical protein
LLLHEIQQIEVLDHGNSDQLIHSQLFLPSFRESLVLLMLKL